jgi:hypothetical protein
MFKTPAFPQYTAQGALTDNATANAAREAYAGELYKTNPEAFYNPNAAPSDALADFTAKKSSVILNPQTGNLELPPGFKVGQTTLPGGQILTQNVPIDVTQVPGGPAYDPRNMVAANPSDFGMPTASGVAPPIPSVGKAFSTIGEGLGIGQGNEFSFDKLMQGGKELFSPSLTNEQLRLTPEYADAMSKGKTITEALGQAAKANAPGFLRSYGPATLAGIGALGAAGGFKAAPAQPSAMRDQLMKPVTQRIAEGGNQRNYYIQGLPGVKYDQYGAPIFGQYDPLPTYDTGLGIASLAGPRGYAEGGEVTPANFDEVAYAIAYPDVAAEIAQGKFKNAYEHYVQYGKAEGRTAFNKAETAVAAAKTATETKEKQATARGAVATAKAARKARGSTSAYDNINAGLAFDAPEGYAASARATRQAAFAPTLNKFIAAGAANTATLSKPYSPTVVNQPYNNATGYANVFSPVATAVNYDTTPVTVQPGVYAPPVFPPFVDNTAAQEAERRRLAEAERVRLAEAERLRLAEAERVRLAGIEAARLAEIERLRVAAAAKAASDRAIFQGQSTALQNQQIMDYLKANPTATDQTLAQQMDYFGIKAPQVAQVVGMENVDPSSFQNINFRYTDAKSALQGNPNSIARQNQADAVTGKSIQEFFAKNPGMGDEQIANYMDRNMIDPRQMEAAFAGTPGAISAQDVLKRYNAAITGPTRTVFATDSLPTPPAKLLNMGGIATLGTGGYPRKTGQINGPGTGTSDSIPAMLSDGEFVMTAKAVRGAGKGDRRAGAKRMYALMNQLEKNAARG